MTNLMKIFKQKLKACLLSLFITITIYGNAQSNVTSALGVTQLLTTRPAGSTANMNAVRSGLQSVGGDCFIITASFVPTDFTLSGETDVFSIELNSALIFEIIVKDRTKWIIRRPTGIADNIDNNVALDYEIYDDLGFSGTFTFIFGHHFTAIAVDVPSGNFKLAPVFFGMDSNLGTFSSHMGEFTGETSNGYSREFSVLKESRVYRMSGDAKIATLIAALNTNNSNIQNARLADEVGFEEDLVDLNSTNNINLYPNPSKGQFELDFNMEMAGEVSYQILDIGGRVISKASLAFEEGVQHWVVNEQANLSAGIYTIKLTGPDWQETRRLLIE